MPRSQNAIPAWSTPITDARFKELTPTHFFRALNSVDRVAWLDSGNSDNGWSYFGINPLRVRQLQEAQNGNRTPAGSWFEFLRALGLRRSVDRLNPDGPPFCGGSIGFIRYDRAQTDCFAPTISAAFFDTILAYDHASRRWWCAGLQLDTILPESITRTMTYKAALTLEQIASAKFDRSDCTYCLPPPRVATSNTTPAQYRAAVDRALKYIRDGDIYQINLAQRFAVPANELPPRELFLNLRNQSPAAFGVFLGSALTGGSQSICSISPELFLRVKAGLVTTRPIKGTRALGDSEEATAAAARALDASAKERAELNMIVDLERNDLGRVCEFGSIRVENSGAVERLPTLLHRTATITGRLRPNVSTAALLRAAFPGGSITGAPKIRAMDIIRELESGPRGLYCGTIGWLGPDGDMELNIAIRTAVHDSSTNQIHYHSGSGIVADSDPDREYEETLLKAEAFFKATNATLQT